jgi:hypothetical protein
MHGPEWKKSVTKRHVLYGVIYMSRPMKTDPERQGQVRGLPGGEGRGECGKGC